MTVALLLAMLTAAVIIGNLQVGRTETGNLGSAPGAFVELPSAAVHYQRVGNPEGSTLVLVHGFGVEGGAAYAGLAGELAGDYDLVIVDLVGFGFSERPTEPGPHLSHRGRAATLASVADQLTIDGATWVGASFGGGVVVELALARPDLVESLVLIDGQLSNLGGGIFRALGAAPLGIGRASTFMAITGGPLARASWRSSCPGSCPIPDDADYRSSVASIEGTTDGFVAMSRTELDSTLPASLSELEIPVLLIWGADDAIIPLDTGRGYAEEIPAAVLEVIAEAGHSPHVDAPEAVADIIRQFD